MTIRTLILKGSGGAGLGDKLMALVVGIMYAQLTKRTLFVDWRDTAYGDGTRNYFNDLFTLVDIPHIAQVPVAGTVFPEAWSGRLERSLDQVVIEDRYHWTRLGGRSRYSFDQSRFDYTDEHLVMWEMDQFDVVKPRYLAQNTEIQGLGDEQVQAYVLERHVLSHESLRVQVAEYERVNFRIGKMVGVHVRKTAESDANRPNPDVEHFVKQTHRLLRMDSQRRVFLACDNRSVIERFQTQFGSERVLVFPKWMPVAGMHMHMNAECPDQQQNLRDAVIDAMLLGKCDWLISSRSSAFSWLARMYSKASHDRRFTMMPRKSLTTRTRDRLQGLAHKLVRRR